MKKLEMEYILLLIDKHTRAGGGYYCDSKKMYEDDIRALKRDVEFFYENHKDEGEK